MGAILREFCQSPEQDYKGHNKRVKTQNNTIAKFSRYNTTTQKSDHCRCIMCCNLFLLFQVIGAAINLLSVTKYIPKQRHCKDWQDDQHEDKKSVPKICSVGGNVMNNQTKHFYIQLKIFQFFNLIMKVIKQLAIFGVYVV